MGEVMQRPNPSRFFTESILSEVEGFRMTSSESSATHR